MYNKPTEAQLEKLPLFGSTEDEGGTKEKTIYMKFFLSGFTWYAREYCPKERLFYGFVNLNDPECAEWGYFSFDELITLKSGPFEVDRDLYFNPTKVKDIKEIVDCCGSW